MEHKLFLIYKPPLYFLVSFDSIGLSVQEKVQIDFQYRRDGGYFRFPIRTISAVSDLQGNALILPTKFQVKWHFGSRRSK